MRVRAAANVNPEKPDSVDGLFFVQVDSGPGYAVVSYVKLLHRPLSRENAEIRGSGLNDKMSKLGSDFTLRLLHDDSLFIC
jgi:hypothetical protein